MAIERRALGAHQALAAALGIFPQACEPVLKFGAPRHGVVVSDTVAVEVLAARPATEGFTVSQISDARGREAFLERLAREPREKPRVRRGADVGHGVDAGIVQQRDEPVGRNVGMADAE